MKRCCQLIGVEGGRSPPVGKEALPHLLRAAGASLIVSPEVSGHCGDDLK